MAEQARVLVTGGRLPVSVGLVQALGQDGGRVDVADTYKFAAALHSSWASAAHTVPSPALDTLAFIDAVAGIVRERAIGLVIPSFEEGFYLARYRHRIPVPVFAPDFQAIQSLHNKAAFIDLCAKLSLPTPASVAVTSHAALTQAVGQFDRYLARPAFSRGGAYCLTNHGPRAGEMRIDECNPTQEHPWVVQEFVEGTDASTFSIVRDGKVLVHGVYEPLIEAKGGFSVRFSSIDDFGTLPAAVKVAEYFGYTGFLCFDCRRMADRFVMLECNPRLDAGVFVTPPEWVSAAVLAQPDAVRMVEAGAKRQYDAILLSKGEIQIPLRERVRLLLTEPDALVSGYDLLPAILFYTGRRHWAAVASREHLDYVAAFVEDVSWDGSPMPEKPE
jgi:hypothetical protein